MLSASDYFMAMQQHLAQLPGIASVHLFADKETDAVFSAIPLPAIFIQCDQLEEAGLSPRGNGHELERVSVDVLLVIDKGQQAAFNFASYVKRRLTNARFGLGANCGKPEKLSAQNTTGQFRGFQTWQLHFVQCYELAPLDTDTVDITEIFVGVNPQADSDFTRVGTLENP